MGLLIGGDFTGYYDWRYVVIYKHYAPDLIYALALLLTNNIYYSFYIYYLIGIFLSILTAILLSLAVVQEQFSSNRVRVLLGILVPVFLLSQPMLYTNTFKSVLSGLVWFQYSAGYSLYLYVHIIKDINKRAILVMLLFSMLVGPLSLPYPNNIRLFIIYIFTTIIYLGSELATRTYPTKQKYKYILLVLLLGAGILVLEIIPKLKYFMQVAKVYSRAHGYITKKAIHSGFVDVLLLASAWTRYTRFCPYCQKYIESPYMAIYLLFLGSIIFIPLILKKMKDPVLVYAFTVILVIVAYNNGIGEKYLPSLIYAILPPSSNVVETMLRYAYIILFSFSIYAIIRCLSNIVKQETIINTIFIIFIIVILLTGMRPALSGLTFSQYFNESIKGIHIPNEYIEIKQYLIKHMHSNDSVIVLPPTSTYIKTKWGYQGTQQWYKAFFYPIKVITLGQYGELLNEKYYNIVTLRFNITPVLVINKFTVKQDKIKSDRIIKITFNSFLNLDKDNYDIIRIYFSTFNCSKIAKNIVKLGLGDGAHIGWHLMLKGSSYYYCYKPQHGYIDIVLGEYNLLYPSNTYELSHIDSILIYIKDNNISNIKIEKIIIGEATKLININNHIRFIIFDKYIISGYIINDPGKLEKILEKTCKVIEKKKGLVLFEVPSYEQR